MAKKVSYLLLVLILLCAAGFLFMSRDHDIKEESTQETAQKQDKTPSKTPLNRKEAAVRPYTKEPVVQNGQVQAADPPGKTNSVIIEPEAVLVYSPFQGTVTYLVVPGDVIRSGQAVAELETVNPEYASTQFSNKEIYQNEIRTRELQIETAYNDIKDLNSYLDDLNQNQMTKQEAYSNGLIDFYHGDISRRKLDSLKEEQERIELEIRNTEMMRDGKFDAIKEHEARKDALVSELSEIDSAAKESRLIYSDFSGGIVEIFFHDGDVVDQGQPLISVYATNVVRVKYEGKIAFSMDQKPCRLILLDPELKLRGIVQLENYNRSGTTDITILSVVLSNHVFNEPDAVTGKNGRLTFEPD